VDLAVSKSQLRQQLIAARKSLPDDDADAAIVSITAKILNYLAGETRPLKVAGYVPMQGECDLLPAMQAIEALGHQICLPVIEGTQRQLGFRRWVPGQALQAGPFGTQVPLATASICDPDLLLVPLVGINDYGVRLGYGGGYYDTTLAALREIHPVVALGIGYDCQRIARLPHEAHDVLLDGLISESGLVFFDVAGQKKA